MNLRLNKKHSKKDLKMKQKNEMTKSSGIVASSRRMMYWRIERQIPGAKLP